MNISLSPTFMDLWIYGFMDLWIYGFMDLWIYGFMDLWIYGLYTTVNAICWR